MNLWVRRTGQLLIVVLFLSSCEDDSFLLGFKNKNKFNVRYQEFLVGEGTVISIDSILTDNLSGTQRLLVGEYIDPIVGAVRTEAFAEFIPTSISKLNASTSLGYEPDSIVFQLKLDYYSYGLVDEGISKFRIHRVTDSLSYRKDVTYKIDNKDSIISTFGANRYYANSTVGYEQSDFLGEGVQVKLTRILGEDKLSTSKLKLSRLSEGKDTLLIRARLTDAFRDELFNVALNDINSELSDLKKFRDRFKGLALIPSESFAVIGYTPASTFSRIRLYYHSTDLGVTKDTLFRDFVFSGVSFHNIIPNRSAELPMVDPPYNGVNPGSGLRVVQSGNPLVTKIDLNNFYTQFADTVDQEIIINSAELVIGSVNSDDGYKTISNLELRVMKENDRYVDYRIAEDSASVRGYNVITDGRNYYSGSDLNVVSTPTSANLAYSSSGEKYSGFVTLFLQSLFQYRDRPASDRLRYLGIYPATAITGGAPPSVGKSINRSVFYKNNIKLKVYYTIPDTPNL